ncbi:hypothetical protein B0T16DRAFT_136691 [Cercophora newfieldiana]|uniref:Uncharacterized protein n=1 Tax=Cercophora newfieldiana TaxID=92897 RepID=A0AA39YBW3_9PEZI|nr:hypothetical protein B0T16DRAFT_136691 [Cercophora newfieldiana]
MLALTRAEGVLLRLPALFVIPAGAAAVAKPVEEGVLAGVEAIETALGVGIAVDGRDTVVWLPLSTTPS